jgi:glycosyltransferase involved in cell wall biosynthesis
VIAATPIIRDKFLSINLKTVDINNFPLLHELDHQTAWVDKNVEVCYVGGIGKLRGIQEMCVAIGQAKSAARLNLVGLFGEPAVEQAVRAMPGWKRVNALGFLDRAGVREVLGRSMAGLVTLHPVINYIDALPVKMFEYMSAGIPVIASDFPHWREIIKSNGCGLLVDPLESAQISQAIDYLVTHLEDAKRMGQNGRNAVLDRYNWPNEEQKLLGFYEQVLSVKKSA